MRINDWILMCIFIKIKPFNDNYDMKKGNNSH